MKANGKFDETVIEYVTVMLDGQLFGLPISRVQDVFMPDRLTRVPLAPQEIAGVLRESLGGLFSCLQAPVQPGLVHRPRDQAADRGEQPHVAVGEVAALAGMHVQHADQPRRPALHRDRTKFGHSPPGMRLLRSL